MAGIDKHKWSWAAKNPKEHDIYFGKHGFVNPVKRVPVKVAHLYEINHKAVLNQLEKKGGKFHFEFHGKILATGSVTAPLSIKAYSWSKNVEKKLSRSGGEISKLEGKMEAGK